MKLIVNGETKDVAAARLDELLGELGLAGQAVAVELNRQVVPKSAHADTPLAEGDAVELVTLVGGG